MKGLLATAIALFVLMISASAHAECNTAPMGPKPAGSLVYNTNEKIFQYCDDTDWIAMNVAGSGTGG